MGAFWLDIRYATRSLVRNRKFTFAVFISLGLGIGLNTVVFSFVNAILLRPFPYQYSDRLVLVWGTKAFEVQSGMKGDEVENWRKQSRVFEDIAVFQMNPIPFAFGPEQSDPVQGTMISLRAFSVLGAQPMLGGPFPTEGVPHHAAVLSYGLWQERFGGKVSIVGKTVELNRELHTVLGVMPRGFFFPDETTRLWVQLTRDSEMFGNVHALGRLRAGATVNNAQVELGSLARNARGSETGSIPGVFPLHRVLVEKYEEALATLFASVLLLLLIACANVSNLLLSRGTSRQRELAVRSALGASRGRVIRLLLIENCLLSLVAGAFGLGCAWWGLLLLRGLRLTDILRFESVGIDMHVLLFSFSISFVTGLISGLVPGWRVTRTSDLASLQAGGNSRPLHESRFRDLLVALEVGTALILLVVAGLLINSFLRLTHSDWGFVPENLLVVEAPFVAQASGQRVQYANEVLDRLARIPHITSCAMAYGVPILYGYSSTAFMVDGKTADWNAETWIVSRDYFRTMGVPILKGREFDRQDSELAARSLVVSKTFAEKLWHGDDPIGKQIQMLRLRKNLQERARRDPRRALPPHVMESPGSWEPDGPPWEVVGMVGDIRGFGLDVAPRSAIYLEYRQADRLSGAEKFVVRTTVDPHQAVPAIKREILTSEDRVTITRVAAMTDLVNQSIGGRGSSKLLLVISLMFGSLSLVLAVAGVYGVVSFGVAQRTREIGVRRALGARGYDIVHLVVVQALRPTAWGLLFGVLGTFLIERFLRAFLFGITPTDPLTLTMASITLVFAVGAACLGPVLRALDVNTSDTLRYE